MTQNSQDDFFSLSFLVSSLAGTDSRAGASAPLEQAFALGNVIDTTAVLPTELSHWFST